VNEAIAARQRVAQIYRKELRDIPGVRFFEDMPGVRHNYSYFPIFIKTDEFGMTRDELYFKMKENNVLGRRYFYPLISQFSTYRGLPSAASENLPVATRIANEVICLPMHHELSDNDIERVLECIKK
jgi:dTDP-4-amino-4,6-dideoxygalactose transaminase